MTIILKEPLNSWLLKHIPKDANENTIFKIKLGAETGNNVSMVEVNLDLAWFIILYVDDNNQIKLDVVTELMQNQAVVANFVATLDNPATKRIIAEFLIFNFSYLEKLKTYINFTKLNLPLDFISHALFIKHSEIADTREISLLRINTINVVLDTGFKLDPKHASNATGAVLHKVLMMEDIDSIFKVARRLLDAGYALFSAAMQSNAEVAVVLLNARSDADALAIINANFAQFKNITLPVAGASEDHGNLADYYYWVKEDMDTVHFIKETLGIELSPTT